MSTFNSSLPSESKPEELSFWQVMGLVSLIVSCHEYYSEQPVNVLFDRILKAYNENRLIILFNHDNQPCAFATYRVTSLFNGSEDMLNETSDNEVLFEDLVSPFSSPILFYRFLKNHLFENNIKAEKAYLLDHLNRKTRKIW